MLEDKDLAMLMKLSEEIYERLDKINLILNSYINNNFKND